jgi:arabinose-5-phosphate isomerase
VTKTSAHLARHTLELQSAGLLRAARRIGPEFDRAVRIILDSGNKVIVTGMGKSGLVGRKVSATFSATGTPAVFLHPAEAIHGDLGVYSAGDPTLLISKSGATEDLLRLVPLLRRFDSPLIGLLGNPGGPLAREVDVVIDASVEREADIHNLVPTTSALVAMALGDALALALMEARQFTAEDFGDLHPGGQIGRNLRLRVRDAMHAGSDVAWVQPESPLKTVVIEMSRHPLGAACVLDAAGGLAGLITEGDLRRALQLHDDLRGLTAANIMTAGPVRVAPALLLGEALRLMEDRPSQISVLPVVDTDTGRCLGLLRIHDIYRTR